MKLAKGYGPHKKILFSAVVIVAAVFLSSAIVRAENKKADPSPEKVLAQINDKKITLQDFEDQISRVSPNLQPFIKAQKGKYLQGIVDEELLYQEALKRKMDSSADIVRQLDQVKRRLVVQEFLEKEVKNKVAVTDAEIQDYYNANGKLYRLPERARISQIVVKDKAKAQEILDGLKKGGDFSALAVANSTDSTKTRGGSMGFVEKGKMGEDFDKIAFALKPGDVSAIVQTSAGFQILKMIDYQGAKTRELAEVKESIRKYLLSIKEKKAMQDYLDGLKSRSNVVVKMELLKEIP